jgi:hypothetical protein
MELARVLRNRGFLVKCVLQSTMIGFFFLRARRAPHCTERTGAILKDCFSQRHRLLPSKPSRDKQLAADLENAPEKWNLPPSKGCITFPRLIAYPDDALTG